ncbi:MAG: glycine--tRNA ligase subunit beta [Rhodospirillales bacterium]|nr:MAG: glycine--tRNA ligase subunit beta [Rhodospirillales bacterium]
MAELLLELISEEIPARMQAQAADDLERLVTEALLAEHLTFTRAQAFVTPRRLALVIDGLPLRQPDVQEERRGPRADAPDRAVEGFLRSVGLSRDQVSVRETAKGSFYFADIRRPGQPTAAVAARILPGIVRAFPWPKSMRWGHGRLRWVRPLHALLLLLDGDVVDLVLEDAAGGNGPAATAIKSGRLTYGHRFLAPGPIAVEGFADYTRKLELARVIVDQRRRRSFIDHAASHEARSEGLRVRPDPALLDEVAGLVEWPVVLMGRIDDAFMTVPREVLTTAMRAHQKYFALEDEAGHLAPRFIMVANTPGGDDSRAIVAGNERVLRARLADARYFWDQDRQRPLESRVADLSHRVFHAELGSDLDRVQRLEALSGHLAREIGADADAAGRAARLCKADLTTAMVGEFPELQGVMGRYYALHDGEAEAVATAIGEHYLPQGPGDRCPSAPLSVALALADRLDTLVGFFAIDEKPTGSKDPFALRRAALGVIRIILDNGLRLPLVPVAAFARSQYRALPPPAPNEVPDLLAFFADRLKVHLRGEGVRHDLVAAVFADGQEDDLVRLLNRVGALKGFLDTDDGANLLAAYKRASNIVRIEESRDGVTYEGSSEASLLSQREEVALHAALEGVRHRLDALLGDERFAEAMSVLSELRPSVDAFFDHVTVNCEDAALRSNRLRLLSQIRAAPRRVADFSLIEG